MAITYKILKKVQVPYRPGYDITALFTDDITSSQRGTTFFFPSETEPTDEKLFVKLDHLANNFQDDLNEEADKRLHPDLSRYEIEKILKQKELIAEKEHFEDLPSKDEILIGGAI